MTAPEVPADVRAALEAWFAPPCPSDMDGLNARMTAALAAADAVRLAGAGDVVEALQAIADAHPRFADAHTRAFFGKTATLVTTLLARVATVEAERDAAWEGALRSALGVVDAEPEPEGEPPDSLHGRSVRNIALSSVRATKNNIRAAILALIEGGRDAG